MNDRQLEQPDSPVPISSSITPEREMTVPTGKKRGGSIIRTTRLIAGNAEKTEPAGQPKRKRRERFLPLILLFFGVICLCLELILLLPGYNRPLALGVSLHSILFADYSADWKATRLPALNVKIIDDVIEEDGTEVPIRHATMVAVMQTPVPTVTPRLGTSFAYTPTSTSLPTSTQLASPEATFTPTATLSSPTATSPSSTQIPTGTARVSATPGVISTTPQNAPTSTTMATVRATATLRPTETNPPTPTRLPPTHTLPPPTPTSRPPNPTSPPPTVVPYPPPGTPYP